MINRTILVGRLTKDPDLRYTPNGNPVTSFTLAVNRISKKEGQPDADFINIVCWNKVAENVANYLKKGSLVGVDGRIQTRNYEGQNGRVYVTEILAENVQFLDSKGSNSQTNTNTSSNNQNAGNGNSDPFSNGQKVDIPDDFPF